METTKTKQKQKKPNKPPCTKHQNFAYWIMRRYELVLWRKKYRSSKREVLSKVRKGFKIKQIKQDNYHCMRCWSIFVDAMELINHFKEKHPLHLTGKKSVSIHKGIKVPLITTGLFSLIFKRWTSGSSLNTLMWMNLFTKKSQSSWRLKSVSKAIDNNCSEAQRFFNFATSPRLLILCLNWRS